MHRSVTAHRVRSALAAALVVVGGTVALEAPGAAAPATLTVTPSAVDGDNGWHRSAPVLTVTAEEPASGVKSLSYGWPAPAGSFTYVAPYPASVSKTVTPGSPGSSTLTATAVSGTGESSQASATVKWDPDAPSQPGQPRWYAESTGLTEAVSSGDQRVCADWSASFDATSGLRDYRVQLSETPDFSSFVVDRDTGTTLARACFTEADGVRYGGRYYLRVSARDVAGNRGSFSTPSSRVSVTDEATGPAVAHAPVPTAYVGQAVPIALTATCNGNPAGCKARLFYRTTTIDARVLDGSLQSPQIRTEAVNVLDGGWTRVDLQAGAPVTLDSRNAIEWTGSVPGAAVTTTGIDYFVEAEDTAAVTQYPGITFVGTTRTGGVEPAAKGFFHVHTVSPPVIVHTPVAYGHDGEPVRISTQTTCSTGNCTAVLYYRTTDSAVTSDPIISAPAWPRVAMVETATDADLGDAGDLITFEAQIPAEYVDTRGVDYFFSVTDGTTTTWWPGTTYVGYYAPTDGMRTGYHHVHVLETPHVAHQPAPDASYRTPIAVTGQSSCSSACTATLYYRTAVATDPFLTTPMAVSAITGVDGVVTLAGTVPADAVDTRGVDYFFSVTDGATTTWWPGTSSIDGYVPVAGTRVAYHHTRVREPAHIAHVPTAAAVPAFTSLTVDVEATCATESCALTLHHGKTVLDPASAYATIAMNLVGPETATPLGRRGTYRAVIPADQVTTAGISYWFNAFDGYVTTVSPGTSDSAAYTPVAARRTGAYTVRVLEPPHVVHAPVLTSYYAQPIAIEARSNCVGTCQATLHWRTSGQPWQAQAMTASRELDGAVVGDAWAYRSTIPGAAATTEGVDYWIEVTDGYAVDSTPTYHTTVLAPTAVLHQPVLSTFPNRDLPIEAIVPCSTPACAVSLSYRSAGGGLLGEPAWTTIPMSMQGAPTSVGEATAVGRYTATIPAGVVTTRGVDYFIHATDGHTNAYSPGTAYAATSATRTDGTRTHYFHVHVAEPVRIVHQPVAVAPWRQPLTITARVNCATRACTGMLRYRATTGLTTPAGLTGYLAGPPFTEVAMASRVAQDAGDAGTVLELTATIPAEAVTTDGLDYNFRVTDGSTTAHYPGTSYVAGAGGVDGVGVAWQHVEVPFRAPVRAISHAPVMASQVRQPIPVRFAAYCTADAPCSATLWFRTTPNPGSATDLGQVLLGEPAWPTARVEQVAVRPGPAGLVLHVFEGHIPAEYVDTRGVDYVMKVADSNGAMYFPGLPYESVVGDTSTPLVAHHVHTLTAPVLHHAPTPAATAGTPVTLTWQLVCSADTESDCRTAAYHRHLATATADTSSLNVASVPNVTLGAAPPPFVEIPTTKTLLGRAGDAYIFEATATIPAAASGFEQYYLWAGDAHTNAYSPGTSYIGGPLPRDGVSLGEVVPWTVRRV